MSAPLQKANIPLPPPPPHRVAFNPADTENFHRFLPVFFFVAFEETPEFFAICFRFFYCLVHAPKNLCTFFRRAAVKNFLFKTAVRNKSFLSGVVK
jgi:hypothetical protein